MYAKKEIMKIGDGYELEVFQLPNGEYQLSRTQVSEAIDVKRLGRDFAEFITGNSPEAVPCKEHIFPKILTEGVGRPITGTSFEVAIAYWSFHARRGNNKALALLAACAHESLQRRADKIFGVSKSELQYTQQTSLSFNQFHEMFTMMQDVHSKLTKIDSMEEELRLLRPAYEKLEKIESTLDDYPNLKEALDYLVENANKAKTRYTLAKWLTDNNLDFIPNNVRMSIGRLVTSWCKLVEMQSPKGMYSDAFDPVLRFAVNYKLTRDSK
jgi:hypothetical protein